MTNALVHSWPIWLILAIIFGYLKPWRRVTPGSEWYKEEKNPFRGTKVTRIRVIRTIGNNVEYSFMDKDGSDPCYTKKTLIRVDYKPCR